MDTAFLTEESFLKEIEEIISHDGLNYIEAVLAYCEKNILDVEDIKPVIGAALRERIRVDATKIGLMKREATLPWD